MKGLYLAAIDIIVDGLDSIAHYPAMWVFTVTAAILTAILIHTCGVARRSGNGAVKSEVLERRGKNGKS